MSQKSTRCRSPLLCVLLGIWIGASALMYFVVTYNFAGFEAMFERNPALAERAGFEVSDEAAMKSSLLWVHSSELNRVFFEVWGVAQLALGALALLVALWRRQGAVVGVALVLALALCAWGHFVLTPEIIELGRTLDFAPRDPPPPELAEFGKKHGVSLGADALRLLCVLVATGVAVCPGRRAGPAPDAES